MNKKNKILILLLALTVLIGSVIGYIYYTREYVGYWHITLARGLILYDASGNLTDTMQFGDIGQYGVSNKTFGLQNIGNNATQVELILPEVYGVSITTSFEQGIILQPYNDIYWFSIAIQDINSTSGYYQATFTFNEIS